MGSTVGSVVAFVREVRLPVGIHLLTLLIELAGGRELVIGSPAAGWWRAQQVRGRGYLEVLPGDRNVFFIDPENPAAGDHQIGDLAVCGLITRSSTLPRASFCGLRTSVPSNSSDRNEVSRRRHGLPLHGQ